jgi:DNA processing protein
MTTDRRTSLMILAALPGMGPVRLRKLDGVLEGKVERLLDMEASTLRSWCPSRLAGEILDWRRHFDPSRVWRELSRLGADYVTFEEKGYPSRLIPYPDRPIGLYRYRAGCEVPERSIAMVGTRQPSAYGRRIARELAGGLAGRGFCIISGLAEGIDTESHQAALQAGGQTLAVLGGGLKCCYPASNRDLMEAIRHSAGVWTEFPLWRRADRRTFPQRNRIVAGMSEGVVVVESGPAGGSLITARMAAEQGKPVYVIPGRIDAPESSGCHALIRDGAQLVTGVDDILEDLDHLPCGLRVAPVARSGPVDPEPSLEGLEASVWAFLNDHPQGHPDDIAQGLDTGIARISGTLLEMEVKGLLCRRLDGRYERA